MESLTGNEAASALWDQLEKINPDIVIAGAIAFPSGATAVHWCKSKRKPVVIFDDVRLQDVQRSWFVNFVKRHIYRNVDAVISPSRSQSKTFEYWGVKRERIFFGLDVVDNDWFAKRVQKYKKNLVGIREELDLPEQFILGVGRFIEVKNWINLLISFAEVDKKISKKKWSLVLVGDGPEKYKIESLCNDRQIENVVIKSFVSQEDLCKYYSLASAVILPSISETWGLVINEAMASSLPVLVSDQCGCVESLVEDGKNGYLFSPKNNSEMTKIIERFFGNDHETKISMGKRSVEIICKWSLEIFSKAVWNAIEYSIKYPIIKISVSDSIIINNWKGRYRPK
jgi:glycosyltransferase involved in cell wall biosynthesis